MVAVPILAAVDVASSCDEHRPFGNREQVRLSPLAGLIAERIEDRRRALAEESPAAVSLTANALAALWDALHGRMRDVAPGGRGDDYFGKQLRGERGAQLEDLAAVAIEEPQAVALAFDEILRPLGWEVSRAHDELPHHSLSGLHELLSLISGQLQASLCRAVRDPARGAEIERFAHDLIDLSQQVIGQVRAQR